MAVPENLFSRAYFFFKFHFHCMNYSLWIGHEENFYLIYSFVYSSFVINHVWLSISNGINTKYYRKISISFSHPAQCQNFQIISVSTRTFYSYFIFQIFFLALSGIHNFIDNPINLIRWSYDGSTWRLQGITANTKNSNEVNKSLQSGILRVGKAEENLWKRIGYVLCCLYPVL